MKSVIITLISLLLFSGCGSHTTSNTDPGTQPGTKSSDPTTPIPIDKSDKRPPAVPKV